MLQGSLTKICLGHHLQASWPTPSYGLGLVLLTLSRGRASTRTPKFSTTPTRNCWTRRCWEANGIEGNPFVRIFNPLDHHHPILKRRGRINWTSTLIAFLSFHLSKNGFPVLQRGGALHMLRSCHSAVANAENCISLKASLESFAFSLFGATPGQFMWFSWVPATGWCLPSISSKIYTFPKQLVHMEEEDLPLQLSWSDLFAKGEIAKWRKTVK